MLLTQPVLQSALHISYSIQSGSTIGSFYSIHFIDDTLVMMVIEKALTHS